MTKNTYSSLEIRDEHLSEDQLLMFVDGELSQREAANAREHLETCWTCRASLERIEETISLFIEFRNKIQTPLITSPPRNWSGFRSSLYKIQPNERKPKSAWFGFSNFSPFQLRIGAGSFAVVLITALIWQLVTVEKVSASELLDRSTAFQKEKINSTNEPVVHQKLRVRSNDSVVSDLEVWNDAENPRSKQIFSGQDIGETSKELTNFGEILQKNKMNPQNPLSPESFGAWHLSLADKVDEVVENDGVTLRTINNSVSFDGQISEATLKFRSNDYHPYQETLRVTTEKGEITFEISEVLYEVVSLNTLKPNFFGDTPHTVEITKVENPISSPSPVTGESPENLEGLNHGNSSEISANGTSNTSTIASADLEIEALQLLNKAKADLGEEITVKRENGVLYIRGLVESDGRKAAILNELQPIRQNPGLRIEIDTITEALAKRKNSTPGKPASIENLESKGLTSAAENDLVEHFGSEEAGRRYAGQVVSRSNQAMSHVYAMRRLVRQFSAEEMKAISPAAKAKWLGLIASHARDFKAESEGLSRELATVFGSPKAGNSTGVDVNGLSDLPQAVESLFAITSNNDRLIRSALTISADDRKLSVLRAAQFWQSLRNAEVLAVKIAALK